MKTNFLVLTLALLLGACNLPTSTPTPLPTPTIAWTIYPSPAPSPTFTPTPRGLPSIEPTLLPALAPDSTPALGVLVRGRVTLDGAGLAGVTIYRKFNAYPNVAIAVTDADGYYRAFVGIPSDEMTSIIPELAGYTFDPPFYYWRHYHGYEETTCDFAALLTP
jgi:hypothetical protein